MASVVKDRKRRERAAVGQGGGTGRTEALGLCELEEGSPKGAGEGVLLGRGGWGLWTRLRRGCGRGAPAGGEGKREDLSARGPSAWLLGWGLTRSPRGRLARGVSGLVCAMLSVGPDWRRTPRKRPSGFQTSEQDAWRVAWWRAAQPPKPVPGFSSLFLDTFVQISRPLTASQVAWF